MSRVNITSCRFRSKIRVCRESRHATEFQMQLISVWIISVAMKLLFWIFKNLSFFFNCRNVLQKLFFPGTCCCIISTEEMASDVFGHVDNRGWTWPDMGSPKSYDSTSVLPLFSLHSVILVGILNNVKLSKCLTWHVTSSVTSRWNFANSAAPPVVPVSGNARFSL